MHLHGALANNTLRRVHHWLPCGMLLAALCASTPIGLTSAQAMTALDAVPDRPLYTLNVTLDYVNNNLHAQERIEFRNPTGSPTTELRFNVPPAHRPGIID